MRKTLIDGRRVDFRNGHVILPHVPSLANMTVPSEADLVTPSATKLYTLGTQVRLDGNLYRYSKAGETIAIGHQGFLKCNKNVAPGAVGGVGYEGALQANAAAGATALYIADTNLRAANYYQDAILFVLNDTLGVYARYRIISSEAGTGTYVIIHIASPGLYAAHTTTSGTLDIYMNPYSNVGSMLTGGGQPWLSAIGMARFPITTAYYFWLLTAGECWGTGASTWPGQTAYQRDVMANVDGSLIGITAATYLYQRVGYLLSGTTSIYGDVFFMLQLDQ